MEELQRNPDLKLNQLTVDLDEGRLHRHDAAGLVSGHPARSRLDHCVASLRTSNEIPAPSKLVFLCSSLE